MPDCCARVVVAGILVLVVFCGVGVRWESVCVYILALWLCVGGVGELCGSMLSGKGRVYRHDDG